MSDKDALARAVDLHRRGRLDEAIAAYRTLLTRLPGSAAIHRGLGLALLQSGRPGDALEALRAAAGRAPDDTRLKADLAAALRANGRHAEAVEIYRGIPAELRGPRIALALGDALHAAGRPLEAIPVLTAALGAGAESNRCRLLLARSLGETGDPDGAVAILEEGDSADPAVREGLANALAAAGRFERAARGFRSLLEERPEDPGLLSQLGAAQLGAGEIAAAEASFRRALAIAPGDHRTVFRLGRLLAKEDKLDGGFLERWLAMEKPVSPLLRASALDWLCSTGEFRRIAAQQGTAPPAEELSGLAGNRILLSVLRRVIVDDPTAERVLTDVRRGLLALAVDEKREGRVPADGLVELACAVGVQCHLNEHVWSVGPHEAARLGPLQERLSGPVAADAGAAAFGLAVLAGYRPLSEVAVPPGLVTDTAGPLRELIRVQVEEPAQEARIAASIPRLNEHRSETSSKVRQQYEEHPYPRWTEWPELPGGSLQSVLTGLFPHLAGEEVAWPESPEMLIAGCGTGLHSIITAQRFPKARILAMDLSRRSLAYALRCTRQAGIRNLEYGQGDLLRVADLGRRFDVIESAGVLHHLLDPLEGWRALVDVLKPGGFMKIGLYSETGRRAVVAGRRFVEEGGWPGTTEGIRAAREAIMALPASHPAAGVLDRPDFYSASACRDLLFHVQEHRYDLGQVGGMIRELGLEFVGFELAGREHAREYRARYPGDPHMLDLANWSEFEEDRPGMFSGMYLFWVRLPESA